MNGFAPQIPPLDLLPEIDLLWDEIQAAISGVIRSGQFVLGPQVRAFEKEIAERLSVRHAVACNSGTDALVIGLRALGIGPGDEVITTPFTFYATAEAINLVGARPVFVDIEPGTFNIDPAQISEALTPRTKAIVPVHLFGHAADMEPILELARRHDLSVVEDVAQALGAHYRGQPLGSLGHVGAFSFYPTKNLGAFGDAGLLTTNDDNVAERARKLRTHGATRRDCNEMIGYNSRLDEIQAAILRVKLPHVDGWNRQRQRAAATYRRLLADVKGIVLPRVEDYADHVFNQFTVRIASYARDAVQKSLAESGIGTNVYYSVPVHRLPVYADHHYDLPVAESASREVLSLPMGPLLSDATIGRVVDALQTACLSAPDATIAA
ncbi:MAG TPA: DegT/DnrJ/EryC1/StrS family aminotransferase [Planctomycetaceae bacterium]|nr:DegT/DnrJ/EryC1/StrS family aminotransferase [Planctomycetaceae bacterium]